MKHLSIFCILLALGLGVWFFGLQQNEEGQKNNFETASLTIATSKLEATTLIRIAEDRGFFDDYNLDVTLTQQDLGKFSLKELLDGNAHLATAAEFPVVKQAFERDDLRLISTIHSSNKNVKAASNANIDGTSVLSPENLRGTRIATTKGTVGEFFLHLLLSAHNVAIDEIELIDMPPEQIAEAFGAGEIDAFSLREPHVTTITQATEDPTVIFPVDPVNEVYTATFNLVGLEGFVSENPEVIERVLMALLDAQSFVENNPEQSQNIIQNQLDLDNEYLRQTWSESVFALSLSQTLLISMDDEARWRIDQGLTDQTEIPNFLDVLFTQPLENVMPDAVTIL